MEISKNFGLTAFLELPNNSPTIYKKLITAKTGSYLHRFYIKVINIVQNQRIVEKLINMSEIYQLHIN